MAKITLASKTALDAAKGTNWNGENLVDHGSRINDLEIAESAIKGAGWDGENLADQEARIVSLEESAATYDSVEKITEGPFTEEGLLEFMVTLDDGIYTINTLRNGTEMFFKGVVTVENIETGLEEQVLRYSRFISNGTSYEWNDGFQEWIMSAGGGGGGGGGGGINPIRLYPYPIGTATTLSAAVNGDLELSIQYQNYLTTTGTLRVFRNGTMISLRSINTGVTSFAAGSYIQSGTNNFDFEVSDAFGNTTRISYLVTGVSVSITSTFNDSVIQEPSGSVVFNILSGGDRYSIVTLDGVPVESPAPTITNVFNFEELSHGTHTLSLQAKSVLSTGTIIYSNTLEYLMIVAEPDNVVPIIASKFSQDSAPEGAVVLVDYIAYQLGLELVNVEFFVDDVSVGTSQVDRSRNTWRIAGLALGPHTLKMVCGVTEKTFAIEITELDVEFTNVEDSFLKLFLSAASKSNTDVDREEWLPNYGETVPVYLQDFNYSTNGWIDGGLEFSGLAKAVIVYKPFASEVPATGATLEFDLETRNSYGELIPFINCMNNGRGFAIYSDRAIIKSSNTSSVAFFKENERIKISFVIDKIERTVTTYINGVMTGLNRLASDSFFVHTSPQNILVNQNNVGGVLYSFRAYTRKLSHQEILQNYLYDLPSVDEKLLEYNVSDIFDDTAEVDFNKISERIPVMKIRAYTTDINGNYLPETENFRPYVDVEFVNPFDHTKDFSFANVRIRAQGTSTLIYPVKNYRLYLPEGSDYQIDVDETRPTLILNIKTDYMESSMATNVGFCKLINDVLYDNKLPIQEKEATESDPYPHLSRSSTYGYPIAMFLDDGQTLRFWGLYNLNTDKSDPQTFGHYPESGFVSKKFENVRNVGNSAGAFIRKPELTDEEWFDEVVADFESNYPKQDPEDATLANYQPLMDVIEFVSDYPGLDDPDIATYKAEFEQRIDIEYAIKYLLTCLVVGAVDSFGKDLMLNTWGNEGGLYPKWYLTFYDLDTCVGIDNTGHMLESDGVTPKYDYDIELVDEGAFAQAQSRLWDVINELFAEEVADYYATLRTGAFSYDTLWHYLYDEQIAKIAKGMYNANAIRKYVEAPGAEQYLHMLHGDRITQMSRWLSNRLLFLDSKYAYNTDAKKLSFRITTDDASQVSFTLTTDTHQWVEILVGNDDLPDSHGIARSRAGVPVVVAPSYASGKNLVYAEGYFYNAERIVDFGDFGRNENYTLDLLNIADAPNLLVCNLEQATPSTSLTSFTIGNNYELTELNLRNNAALTGVLNLSACTKLSKLDLRGTGITSVEFPVGGVLEECYLPNTLTSLTLINQPYLNSETFSVEAGAAFDYLRVENCPGVDIVSLLGMAGPTVALRLLDINLSTYGSTTIDAFIAETASAVGIDIDGNITGSGPILYGNIKVLDPTDSIDLSVYAAVFPNITFSKIVVNADFTVSSTMNDRDNCILESYNGSAEIVEIPTTEFNAYLSPEILYTVGQYGWGIIDEIGVGAFGAGIKAVHLTEIISVVNNLAFSASYTGVVTTPASAVPSGWILGATEIKLNSSLPVVQDSYLLSLSGSNVNLFRYYGAETELALPTTLTIDEISRVPNYLSKDLFLPVDDQITELHIPSNISTIGAGFSSYLNDAAIIWAMAGSKPSGWNVDWNSASIEQYYGAPATKRTFNIYNDASLVASPVEYGLLDTDRATYAYGHGLYADELFNAEISYPYYGSGESNDLYMSLILAPVQYTYDAVDGNQYYVSGYDRTRLEGDGTIKLVIASTYNDGINGSHPVTYVGADAIGHSLTSEASVLKEVVFQTNLNFKYNGYPEGMLGGATHLTTFVPPAGVTVIPRYFRANCQLLPMMSLDSVTSIGDYAFFENRQIEEIIVPDTVTYIGQNSFLCSISDNSSLMTVIMYASGATIGDTAFVVGNYFRDVYTVSDTGIYERQEDNTWIQFSELPIDEQYFTINESGLITSYDIAGGTELVPPATVDGVTVVGYAAHALDGVAITTLYLGNNIRYIGNYAFADTSITSVIIPNSVTYIGANAFLGLSEIDITLGTGVTSYVVYEDDGATLAGHIASFEDSSFAIPATVNRVKSYAFESSLIETLEIHAGVTVIEDRAFINSSYLSTISLYAERQNISLGSSLIIEGDNAFNTAVANEPSFNGRGVYEKQLDNSWLWIEEVWLYTWSVDDFLYGDNSLSLSVDPAPVLVENFFPPESYINIIGINKVDKTIINIPHSIYGKQVYVQSWNLKTQQAVIDEMEELNFHPNTVPCQHGGGGTIGGIAYIRYIPSLALSGLNALAGISGIPTILNSIGTTFQNCKNLVSVTNIPNTITNMVDTFYGCSSLINAPLIPNSVTNMVNTFRGCSNLINVPAIPNSTINMFSTFRDCYNLVNAPVIPNSVASLFSTFRGCSNLVNAPLIPNSVTDMSSTFYNCINLINAPAIPNSVTDMSSTFQRCFNLVNAPLIPNSVISMYSTFQDCSSLVNVPDLPNSVTNMSYTFNGCSRLVNAPVIPNSVTSMFSTFQGCSNLVNAPLIPNSVTDMSSTFYNCINLINVPALPNSVTNMAYTFYGCSNLIDAPALPNSVTGLSSTFYNCINLVNAPAIPNSVTDMYSTFQDCSSLVNVPDLPNSVTNMYYTFYGCSRLVNAPVIPNSVTSMFSTFQNCSNLVNAPVIPNSVASLSSTFRGCSRLVNAPHIPNSVTNMYSTFQDCSNLINVPAISNSVTNMSSTFQDCFSLVNAPVIPNSVTDMYATFQYCSNLINAPHIPNSVTNMYFTFYSCSNLINVPAIPNSVTDMSSTFQRCFNLVNAPLIPNSVINMASTFRFCSSLTGDIIIQSDKVLIAGGMTGSFRDTSLPKDVYIPYTGFNATHNTKAAADYSSIDGNNGVTVMDINTYLG